MSVIYSKYVTLGISYVLGSLDTLVFPLHPCRTIPTHHIMVDTTLHLIISPTSNDEPASPPVVGEGNIAAVSIPKRMVLPLRAQDDDSIGASRRTHRIRMGRGAFFRVNPCGGGYYLFDL